MRLKCVEVSRELIEQFLTTGRKERALEIVEGVPCGARLIAVQADPNPYERLTRVEISTVRLVFEHESFPDVPVGSGALPPALSVILRSVGAFPEAE
jgi:hypothetical protein